MERWTYSDDGVHGFRILGEWSLHEMKCEIHICQNDSRYTPLPAEHLLDKPEKIFASMIGGQRWVALWSRRESDSRGNYIATALVIR